MDIVLNDSTRQGDGGDAEGDQLRFIENAVGSDLNDDIMGNNDVNVIDGRDGNDEIQGLGGADELRGGAGDDIISGGSGNDRILGGAGNDTVSGGSGADEFIFAGREGGFGDDTITDFQTSDIIELLGISDVSSFADLTLIEEVQVQADGREITNTLIELDAGTILLEDVQITDLSASDFFIV